MKIIKVRVVYETIEDYNHVLKSECGKYYHGYIYNKEDDSIICAFFTRKQSLTRKAIKLICNEERWIIEKWGTNV